MSDSHSANADLAMQSHARAKKDWADSFVRNKQGVSPVVSVLALYKMFETQADLNSIVIHEGLEILGIVQRQSFLRQMSQPYALDLASKKTAESVMDKNFLQLDRAMSLQQVSRLITSQSDLNMHDDFVVTDRTTLLGTASVAEFIQYLVSRVESSTKKIDTGHKGGHVDTLLA